MTDAAPDAIDLRMAYTALRVEHTWRLTYDQAMAAEHTARLIHARASQIVRARARRMAACVDHKQLQTGETD